MSENGIDLGGGFAALLQNPEIAAKLPRIMEALAPVMAEMKAEKGSTTEEKGEKEASGSLPDTAAISSILSGIGKKSESTSTRFALLRALEPYLSESRKEAMEYILKVSSLLDILSEVM